MPSPSKGHRRILSRRLRPQSAAGWERWREPQNWDTVQSKTHWPNFSIQQRGVGWESVKCGGGCLEPGAELGTEPLGATTLFARESLKFSGSCTLARHMPVPPAGREVGELRVQTGLSSARCVLAASPTLSPLFWLPCSWAVPLTQVSGRCP